MKKYEMICENCGHVFWTDDKMDECPKCGDLETTPVGDVAKNLSRYESIVND